MGTLFPPWRHWRASLVPGALPMAFAVWVAFAQMPVSLTTERTWVLAAGVALTFVVWRSLAATKALEALRSKEASDHHQMIQWLVVAAAPRDWHMQQHEETRDAGQQQHKEIMAQMLRLMPLYGGGEKSPATIVPIRGTLMTHARLLGSGNILVAPATGELKITGFAPTVAVTADRAATITPTKTATATVTGTADTVHRQIREQESSLARQIAIVQMNAKRQVDAGAASAAAEEERKMREQS